MTERYAPGRVRDGILQVLSLTSKPLSVREIGERVGQVVGPVRESSIRSYLRLNTPGTFVREERGYYALSPRALSGLQYELPDGRVSGASFSFGKARLYHADCFDWLGQQEDSSIHAVVTDPPYGLHEYTPEQQAKLRKGEGGVWRLPPSFDGHTRSPVPRFTTLTPDPVAVLKDVLLRLGAPAPAEAGAGGARRRGVESPGVLHRLDGPFRRGIGAARGDRAPHHDDARRRPAQGRPSGVLRRDRYAPLHVGTVACVPQTYRGQGAGQLEAMGHGRLPPAGCGQALRRCDSVGANPKVRAQPGPASQPQAASLPSTACALGAAPGRGCHPRPVRGRGFNVGCRRGHGLCQYRSGKGPALLQHGPGGHPRSWFSSLPAQLARCDRPTARGSVGCPPCAA